MALGADDGSTQQKLDVTVPPLTQHRQGPSLLPELPPLAIGEHMKLQPGAEGK